MFGLIQSLFKKNKIRNRMLSFFLVTILLMSFTSFYTYFSSRLLLKQWDNMFYSNVYLNDLYRHLSQSEKYLEQYLSTKHSESFSQFMKYSTYLQQEAQKIDDTNTTDEKQLLLKDIKNMVNTYLFEAEAAIKARRGRNIIKYTDHYVEATKVAEYINLYINRLNMECLQENTTNFFSIKTRINLVQLMNIFLIIWFSYKITQPIIDLSSIADEVSAGNYDVENIEVYTDDELSVLTKAFNRMVKKVKEDINEIKGKARLKEQLKEKEMQNLIMKNLLKETELFALQSQINPHFIFNTLNAGMQLAMFEKADKTVLFMEDMANYLRYNMTNLNKAVTLKDELENLKNYINILKTRYGDKIQVEYNIEKSILDSKMPSMILQPVVENAFIHGINEMEDGGKIIIKTKKTGQKIKLTIADNGKGFTKRTRDYILSLNNIPESQIKESHTGKNSGIGLGNIIYRLKLFYNIEEVINIKSVSGDFTMVILTIPYIPYRKGVIRCIES